MKKDNRKKEKNSMEDSVEIHVEEETLQPEDDIAIESEEQVLTQEEEVEEKAPLEEQDEKYDQLKEQFMRLQADFVNFKRRTASEKAEYIELGVKKLATDILPVIDNFERALENAGQKDAFYEGIEMIMAQLKEALQKEGITEMDSLGQPFDPNLHHAVMTAPSQEYEPDYVMEVLQKGYLMNEKALRPAMVKVSQ